MLSVRPCKFTRQPQPADLGHERRAEVVNVELHRPLGVTGLQMHMIHSERHNALLGVLTYDRPVMAARASSCSA